MNRYGMVALAVAIACSAGTAVADQYLTVGAKPGQQCIPLQQAGAASIALTPGVAYTATVDGDAYSNPTHESHYDGVYCYYFDGTDPNRPRTVYLRKEETLEFVASDTPFYAFLADLSLKDIADNGGSMLVTFTAVTGAREALAVDAVFNCIGLRDFGAAETLDLIPYHSYTAAVAGDAFTNGTGSGFFDGVYVWYREPVAGLEYAPIQDALLVGQVLSFTECEWGWFYAFLVDESIMTMGNNGGSMTITFVDVTAVEEETWGAIKALFR